MDLFCDFPFIRIIIFIINLCLILVITVVRTSKKIEINFLPSEHTLTNSRPLLYTGEKGKSCLRDDGPRAKSDTKGPMWPLPRASETSPPLTCGT
jgi:hypothetical protein